MKGIRRLLVLQHLEIEGPGLFEQHIAEINTVIKAPKNICKKLGLDEKSCWQLCCAAVLDSLRPLKNGQNRVDDLKKLINRYRISYI